MSKKVTEKPIEFKPSLYFDFPKDNKGITVPENFDDLEIDKEITVAVKGKVTSISHDERGKSFRLDMTSIEIETQGKSMSIKEAIEESKKERKA